LKRPKAVRTAFIYWAPFHTKCFQNRSRSCRACVSGEKGTSLSELRQNATAEVRAPDPLTLVVELVRERVALDLSKAGFFSYFAQNLASLRSEGGIAKQSHQVSDRNHLNLSRLITPVDAQVPVNWKDYCPPIRVE